MWNSEFFLLWSHISRLYYEDLECGLKLVNKLTSDHINLTSYSVMRVNLAVQVLSETDGNVLNSFGPEETAGTAKFCIMVDKFFDCLNVRNTTEHITKRKPFLKSYYEIDDARFEWLDEFIQYFSYGKNLSRKGMMQITQKMQGPKCLFHGRAMKDYRLQFCHLKRFVNFY